jgi:hypothetical protein
LDFTTRRITEAFSGFVEINPINLLDRIKEKGNLSPVRDAEQSSPAIDSEE